MIKPEIIAEITLRTSSEGGRKGPILSGEYLGVFGAGEQNFSVRFWLPDSEDFAPGQTRQVSVQFLFPEAAIPYFPAGAIFTVREGKIIGDGIVIKVCTTEKQ